jgi:hypothetical protein
VTPSERREKTLNYAGTCTHAQYICAVSSSSLSSSLRGHHRGGVVTTTCDGAANLVCFFLISNRPTFVELHRQGDNAVRS